MVVGQHISWSSFEGLRFTFDPELYNYVQFFINLEFISFRQTPM